MEKKVRWGVLGYARVARENVMPAFSSASNAELAAVASRDKEKLKECVTKFGELKTYESYNELLDDPDIDAVYIPLPNSMHKEWTIKAALKKKHILCEKPLALSEADAAEMIEACKKNNVKLMEAFMYRYTNRIKKVEQILKARTLGEIKYINSSFRFLLSNPASIKLKPELGGGSLYDVGCYPINFIGMITKEIPVSMKAEYSAENKIDHIFSAVLKYPSGIIATMNCGFNAYRRVFSEIVGTKGVLEVPDTFLDNDGFLTMITDDGIEEIFVEKTDRYLLEIEDFSDAVLKNRQPFFSTEESIRNMKILESLFKLII